MARYEPREIVENLEGEARAPATILEKLKSPLGVLKEHQAVDRVPEGARLRPIKSALSKLMSIVASRQATYNSGNIEIIEALAAEVDRLRRKVQAAEDSPARVFGMSELGAAETARLRGTVEHHFHSVQRNLDHVTRNLGQMAGSVAELVENLELVAGKLDSVNTAQEDFHTQAAGARLDVTRLWTEVGVLYENVEQRADDLWRGLEERDTQLVLNADAARDLHTKVGSAEAGMKELRARILVLGEQIALQQEMLDNMKGAVLPARAGIAGGEAAARAARTPTANGPDDSVSQRQLDLAYLRFQREFRADEADLRARQQSYVTLLRAHLPPREPGARPYALDVACGDGIFVELLARDGWDAEGVDINRAMVKIGTERGLNITEDDAIEYLEAAEQGTLDAVSMFQFVEHLPPAALMRVLRAAFRALKPAGLLLVETINPRTMKSLHWYHLDLSHERLVFPEMLSLLAETAGLSPVEWKGINPVAAEQRLAGGSTADEVSNIAKLNDFLFGDQDYYLLARKPTARVAT